MIQCMVPAKYSKEKSPVPAIVTIWCSENEREDKFQILKISVSSHSMCSYQN